MNAIPHGAMVVPIVAVIASRLLLGRDPRGHDGAVQGRAPVGPGQEAGDDVEAQRRGEDEQDPLDAVEAAGHDQGDDPTAATGTLIAAGTPARPSAAATPANSAHVVPRFAMTSAVVQSAAARTP